MADSTGSIGGPTAGTVQFDTPVDSGNGVGGGGTNNAPDSFSQVSSVIALAADAGSLDEWAADLRQVANILEKY